MSKESFVWTDELVKEYVAHIIVGKSEGVTNANKHLQDFKESKMPKKKASYVLLKDLPNVNSGASLFITKDGNYECSDKYEGIARFQRTVVENHPEWFGLIAYAATSPQPKPEQPKRIEVTFSKNRGIAISRPLGEYSVRSSNQIPEEKFPAIKEAIERVLNDRVTDDSYEGVDREELIRIIYYWRNNNQGNYDRWKESNYKLREAEEKAFNAGRELRPLADQLFVHPDYQHYLSLKNSEKQK